MIFFRYLAREVLTVFLAVLLVLLLVFLSDRLVRIMSAAADGSLSSHLIFSLVMLEIPKIVIMLLPLSLFLGILIAYGRLHTDSEMTVLFSCGLGRDQLVLQTLKIGIIPILLTTVMALWVGPYLTIYKEKLYAASKNSSILATIAPGRFQESNDGKRIYYVEEMSRDRMHMKNIFVAEKAPVNKQGVDENNWSVLSAVDGYQRYDDATQQLYFVTENGNRYEGTPGHADFQILNYQEYDIRVGQQILPFEVDQEAMPSGILWKHYRDPINAAELQWRIASPIAMLLLLLLAVPLSHIEVRRGKFARLVPGMIIYMMYVNLLSVSRAWIIKGKISSALGLWWVHLIMLAVVSIYLFRYCHWRKVKKA